MAKHLNAGTNEQALSIAGDIRFSDATLSIPIKETAPAPVDPGEIYYIPSSGLIIVASGGLASADPYDTFSMGNLRGAAEPDTIAGIQFWYEASSGNVDAQIHTVEAVTSGGDVKLWNDLSANNNNAGAVVGFPGVWYPDAASVGLPGVPYVDFPSSSLFEISGIHTLFNGNDAETTFCTLVSANALSATMNILMASHATNASKAGHIINNGPSYAIFKSDDVPNTKTVTTGTPAPVVGNPQFIVYRINGTTADIYVNGSGVITGADIDVPSISCDNLRLGGKEDGAPAPQLNGKIFETFLYDSAISDDHIADLGIYIQNKYGIVQA